MSNTQKKKGKILTVFMFVILLPVSVILSLRLGILDGNMYNVLKKSGVFTDIEKTVVAKITNNSEEAEKIIDKVLPDDFISDTVKIASDAVMSGKDIDAAKIKRKAGEIISNTADVFVDEFIDSVKQSGGVISAETIGNNPVVNEYATALGQDIEWAIYDSMNVSYGAGIDLSKIDTGQVKEELKTQFQKKIYPVMTEYVDKIVDEISVPLNRTVMTVSQSSYLQKYTKLVDFFDHTVPFILAFMTILLVILIVIQLIIRNDCKIETLNSVGKVALVSGGITAFMGLGLYVVWYFMGKNIDFGNALSEAVQYVDVAEISNKIVAMVGRPFIYVGILMMISGAICMVITMIKKKKYTD